MKWASSFSLVIISLLVALAFLELGLHLFPVNEVLSSMPVNDRNPVLRFKPNQDLVWSKGASFYMVNDVHMNNYGFVNNQNYVPEEGPPLVAVIGDSFVEALMVPGRETGQEVLAQSLKGRARVYSFGRSGAPLSQYLGYAQWVRDEFSPEKMVFVVVGNDFDESLFKYKQAAGFHYFKKDENGALQLDRVDYSRGVAVEAISRSKLLMYLFTNVKIMTLAKSLKYRWKGDSRQFAGQTLARADAERMCDSREAVRLFFKLLPECSGLAKKDICFVVDGLRPHLYAQASLDAVSESYFSRMRSFFMDEAEKLGYQVVDMQPVFLSEYKRTGDRFEYPMDGHWNSLGHRLFARSVLESGFLQEFEEVNQ